MSNQQVLKVDQEGAHSIDQYLEYKRIVRDDDHGILFSDVEYENYKKTVVAKRIKHRLFVSWKNNETMMECKQIGPESKCFCKHRYHQHKTDFAIDHTPDATRKITGVVTGAAIVPIGGDMNNDNIDSMSSDIRLPCEESGCPCNNYCYVSSYQVSGNEIIQYCVQVKCRCKHTMDAHNIKGKHSCTQQNCKCKGYFATLTCSCGSPAYNHSMSVETKLQRLQNGKPIGRETPYKAMGGLTGHSSLADGVQRLDSSGIEEESIYQRPGEDDMDYYERRYKERKKQEKINARAIKR